jgi:hypothetical protein
MNKFAQPLIAIDDGRSGAVHDRERSYTKAKIRSRIDAVNWSLDRYWSQPDSFYRQDEAAPDAKTARIHKHQESLKRQMAEVKAIETVIDLASY